MFKKFLTKETFGQYIKNILKFVQNNTEFLIVVAMAILLAIGSIYLSIENSTLRDKLTKHESDLSIATSKLEELTEEHAGLLSDYSQLTETNESLNTEKQLLEQQVQELLQQIEELNKRPAVSTPKRDFKSYMPYTALKDKTSPQWQLQLQATTNSSGIRCYYGLPMIAVGTGWGLQIGDTALVVCENGNSFLAVVGDWKADRHTDSSNKTTLENGCRCEFIVDLDVLDDTTRTLGNIAATMPEFAGYVVSIVEVSLPSKS